MTHSKRIRKGENFLGYFLEININGSEVFLSSNNQNAITSAKKSSFLIKSQGVPSPTFILPFILDEG